MANMPKERAKMEKNNWVPEKSPQTKWNCRLRHQRQSDKHSYLDQKEPTQNDESHTETTNFIYGNDEMKAKVENSGLVMLRRALPSE
jgi:hypothetical protein